MKLLYCKKSVKAKNDVEGEHEFILLATHGGASAS
jgi:hypothetical protein